ncbi:MAG: release factor glutamine methyltransferase [Cellvibrionaceae bacterium]|jgi:release factor glutamine methyltransferase
MDTIQSLLADHQHLKSSDSSRLDCELLLCSVLQKDRTYLYTWPEKVLSSEQVQGYLELFFRRKKGEPIAYILGEKEFWSLPLVVNASTLIPRPETELLVESVLALMESKKDDVISVADLGTGTGAIGLALASERPCWQIIGLEKNVEAFALAQENKKQLKLGNIAFYLSDWFDSIPNQRFDVIVSNPPYIDADDHHLREGDVRFEPRAALVADNNGLADLELIIQASLNYLLPNAWLLLEHGNQQSIKVGGLLTRAGFKHVQTKQDLAGQPRVTLGQRLI